MIRVSYAKTIRLLAVLYNKTLHYEKQDICICTARRRDKYVKHRLRIDEGFAKTARTSRSSGASVISFKKLAQIRQAFLFCDD